MVLYLQGLSLVGPFERFSHRAVIIVDERQDLGLQVLDGKKRAPFEQLAHQNAEPDFDLIHPRTVLGGGMDHHLLARITQKCRTAGHGGQNPALAIAAQLLIQATRLCDPADQCLGLMDVEIITDKVEAGWPLDPWPPPLGHAPGNLLRSASVRHWERRSFR